MSQTMILMSAALVAELILGLIVVLSVAYLRNRAARRRDRAAIQALVARVRQDRPQREQAIAQFLGAGLGYEGAGLSDSTALLARAELQLLQRFALLYRDRNADLAARFDGELSAMLDAYHALAASALGAPATDAEQPVVDNAELDALRRENTRLSDELRITMETMSRMLNEYSTMFAPVGEPEALEPVAEAADDLPGSASAVAVAVADGATDDWASALDAAAQGEGRDAAGPVAAVDAPVPADEFDEGEWEVAVDAGGAPSDGADDGEWEVAVSATGDTGGETLAEEVVNGFEVEVREPEDPLAEIMRAAADQEKSAREAQELLESAQAADAKPARAEPEPVGGEDVDLFDVVMEGTPTPVAQDSVSGAGVAEEPGEDLFDVVEAPRSRSAS